MKLKEILGEIDMVIKTAQAKNRLTEEEKDFFGQLKKRTEDMDDFFKRLQKNAGLGKRK